MEKNELIVQFSTWLFHHGINPNQYPLFEAVIFETVEELLQANKIPVHLNEGVYNTLFEQWKDNVILLLNRTNTSALFRGVKLSDYSELKEQIAVELETV